MRRRRPQLVATAEGIALAVLSGYVGTKAMEPVSQKLYELESVADRAREDAARPGPPYRIAVEKLASLSGLHLDDAQLVRAALVLHYGLAVSLAPVYMLLRRAAKRGPVTAALVTGSAMSLVADELMTPAFGFSAPNLEYPLATHLRGIVAHLSFGLVVAAVNETAWWLLGHQPHMKTATTRDRRDSQR